MPSWIIDGKRCGTGFAATISLACLLLSQSCAETRTLAGLTDALSLFESDPASKAWPGDPDVRSVAGDPIVPAHKTNSAISRRYPGRNPTCAGPVISQA